MANNEHLNPKQRFIADNPLATELKEKRTYNIHAFENPQKGGVVFTCCLYCGDKLKGKWQKKFCSIRCACRWISKNLLKGVPRTKEVKDKIGIANSGCKNYMYGKKANKQQLKGLAIGWGYFKGKKCPDISKRMMGKNNPSYGKRGKLSLSWKGKRCITPENLRIRMSKDYCLWRDAVFIKDNFTCQKYNIKGNKLNAHHINNFSNHPKLRLTIDNGITLSEKAHKEFHKIYGKRNNTREQLEEFLGKPIIFGNIDYVK